MAWFELAKNMGRLGEHTSLDECLNIRVYIHSNQETKEQLSTLHERVSAEYTMDQIGICRKKIVMDGDWTEEA